ncbi:MAG: winged helix-turn-helix domain-containing protein [Anaerolineae bacterium]|nr:winged helix-turn-helix domain-containing protein [Anaerolineae bacterium]
MSTPLDNWLKNLGFIHGNPFVHVEADRERAILPATFVDVEGYDRIKSANTIIVFAPRGGGKSALRIMLASYTAPIEATSSTLTLEYTNFNHLIERWRQDTTLTINDHVQQLLRLGCKALYKALFGSPELDKLAKDSSDSRQYRIARAIQLSPPVQAQLSEFLHTFVPELLRAAELGTQFHYLDSDIPLSPWQEFTKAVSDHRLRQFVDANTVPQNPTMQLLANVNDFVSEPLLFTDPTRGLNAFVDLIRRLGFEQLFVLVDRLDETQETADDLEAQADLLEPLLAHLPVLEIPHIAYKFFLSRPLRDVLWNRPTVRRDRLEDYEAVDVTWDDVRLKAMLDARLKGYSKPDFGNPNFKDWSELCVDAQTGIAMEQQLLTVAQDSPRRLLLAAQLVCETHVKRLEEGSAELLLDSKDWEKAQPMLHSKLPFSNLLRIDLKRHIAVTPLKKVELTGLDYEIIRVLVEHDGFSTREQLMIAVPQWNGIASDYAIDRAISRLRHNLDENGRNPQWLMTVRGHSDNEKGFRLRNYMVLS